MIGSAVVSVAIDTHFDYRRTDRRTDGRTDGQTDGRTEKHTFCRYERKVLSVCKKLGVQKRNSFILYKRNTLPLYNTKEAIPLYYTKEALP